MVNSTEAFVSSFESLTGETLSERRKHFSTLLSKTQQTLKNGCEEIDFAFLNPKNYFEDILKVEALIYFRRGSDLLEILKSENPIHIAKVLKASSTFTAQVFGKINGDELIEEIFPFLSFNTKLKLVNKLAVHLGNAQKVEDYFEAIRQNYGLHLASKLLPGCSGNFIIKCIKAYRIEITPGQLMVIIKKYPEITETVFEELQKCNNKIGIAEKYTSVFTYMVQHKSSLFLKLNEKYNPDVRIGRRATQNFICKNKQYVIRDSKKIYKLLKSKQVFKSLKDDYSEFYINLFPRTLGQCEEEFDNLLCLLKHTPSDWQKVNLLPETFKKIYGSELWEHPKFVVSDLIEAMSPEDREIWMQTHSKPNEISEEQWISCMKAEKSLPLLKERISFTSNIKARAKLIAYLVTTCKINNDILSLVDVCKYMISKHHNDHYSVRQGFLRSIKSCFNLDKLEESHWVHINELLHLGMFDDEHFYEISAFLKAYIKYCLDKNLPVEEQLTRWMKGRYHRLSLDNPKYEPRYLPLLGNVIGLGYKDDEVSYAHVEYLNHLSCWNERNPNHQISLLTYSTSLSHFKSSLKTGDHSWSTEKILLQLVQQPSITEQEKLEMLIDFFTCQTTWMDGALLKWILLNKPMFIINNGKIITDTLLRVGPLRKLPSVWLQLKRYSHLGMPEKLCEIFLEKLKTKQEDIDFEDRFNLNQFGGAVTAMSYLMDSDEFINLISPYYPLNLTADMNSQEGLLMCKIQKSIAGSVRNIIPPSLALTCVLHFCKGDYLKFVQKSLHLVSQNIAESKVSPFLKEINSRAVSVRKHSIYITVKVSNKTEICEMFKRQIITEKNFSIRKSLFKGAFNAFVNYSNDYFWELLKETVMLLDTSDNEAFKVLTKWKRIPRSYLQFYIPFAWDVLDNLSTSNEIEENLCQILDAITPDIVPALSKQFCTRIIEKYLFKSTRVDHFRTNIILFTSRCIIYCQSELDQEEYLKFTFSLLKNFVASSWYDSKSYIVGRKSVFSFITTFCGEFLEKKCAAVIIFRKFIALWNDFLKAQEALNIYLYLQFTLISLESSTLLQIGERLLKLYDSLLNLNGSFIVDSFDKILQLFLKYFLLSDVADIAEENRYILMDSVIKNGDSVNRFILIIFLLPSKIPSSANIKFKYESIMEVLLKKQEPIVQIYLDKYSQHSLEQ